MLCPRDVGAAHVIVTPRMPRPGDVVAGTYVLSELIGQGGMGIVFRAEQASLARTVAVKFLHPELVHRAEIVRRFRDEAWAASRLAHPACVTIFDRGDTDDGVPFLVMEYVRGPSLTAMVQRDGPLSVARTLALVRQILAGLAEAHAAGIAHGDVKSDNVLVEFLHDGTEQAKVLDFGLARAARRAAGATDHGHGLVSGTPEYMAPELILGDEANPGSDLYAVGVILYELLTGEPPFTGASPAEVLTRHLEDVVVPPSLRRPDGHVPPAVERLVLRALAKKPAGRFADAGAFAAALEAAIPPGAPAQRQPCRACGTEVALHARYCPQCGAALTTTAPLRTTTESPTLDWDTEGEATPPPSTVPRSRLARGSVRHDTPASERVRTLRQTIGLALARGAVEDVADGYLELARVLAGDRRHAEAEAELVEAIDVVTAGAGPDANQAPAPLWRLLIALALLYDADGDRARARLAAARAFQHAVASRSVVGRDRARALLARLG